MLRVLTIAIRSFKMAFIESLSAIFSQLELRMRTPEDVRLTIDQKVIIIAISNHYQQERIVVEITVFVLGRAVFFYYYYY